MNGKMVFVLEDDPDISEIISYVLTDAGYQVQECSTVNHFNKALSDLFLYSNFVTRWDLI